MKKTLLVIFCILFSLAITAQTKDYYKEKKHEIRLSIGSVNDNYYHYDGYYYYGGYFGGALTPATYDGTGSILHPKKTSGVYGLSYYYHAPWINGRFSIGGSFAFSNFKQNYTHRLTSQKVGNIKEYNIALSPSIRYAWVSKPIFQFYSGIGVSIFYNDYKHVLKTGSLDSNYKDDGFEASFMVTPIGFSVGRNIFAFGEINLGGRAGEFVGGVGYRF